MIRTRFPQSTVPITIDNANRCLSTTAIGGKTIHAMPLLGRDDIFLVTTGDNAITTYGKDETIREFIRQTFGIAEKTHIDFLTERWL